MKFQQTLEVIEGIAKSYSEQSAERSALESACRALLLVERQRARDEFEEYINASDRPLSGIELIQLKTYGLDIPEEQRTPRVLELERDIDLLVAKLHKAGKESGTSGGKNKQEMKRKMGQNDLTDRKD